VRGLARRRCKGQSDDALGDRGVELGDARGTRLVAQKALEALVGEAFLPAPDAGLGLAGSRMIAFVPTPSAVSSTICARQTCFCDALRSLTGARSRALSANVTEREMLVRIRQTRTPQVPGES
jgi:hypothetical protein